MRRTPTAFAVALALATAGMAQAATVTVFDNLAAWEAAISGSAQLQDFSSYAGGTDLTGVAVLPGVTLTSNLGPVEVFGAAKAAMAFGPRANGNAYYEAQYALPFLAAAVDITAFESIPGNGSTAVDQGLLSFLFSDGSTQDLLISGNATSTPIFVGVISDSTVTSFRWTEAHEASGGNEETSLDNLRVAMRAPNELPLPGTLSLAMLALTALPLARRRRS